MDEIVSRSMLKWPDVPAVYGWLSLDRRGNWAIKTAGGRFERIANAAVREFIGRNYAADAGGRWYFQNGPQRVFVALDYTPWVYRLADAGEGILAHTGAVAIFRPFSSGSPRCAARSSGSWRRSRKEQKRARCCTAKACGSPAPAARMYPAGSGSCSGPRRARASRSAERAGCNQV